jgi:hypothetical protein
VDDPTHGRVLRLREGDPNSGLWLGWAGDDSWKNYRVEVEVLPEGRGFVGLDFHVRDDESGCCNLHFPASPWPVSSGSDSQEAVSTEADTQEGASPAGGKRIFEGCGRWDDVNTSWKLGPMSQRTAPARPGAWLRLRLDAGEAIANLYQDDDPEPVFTAYDLPFDRGGVRLWRYHASAYFRNLRVTALNSVEPILGDAWGSVIGPGVIRDWQISRMLPQDFGSEGRTAEWSAADMSWRKVSGDRRGVINVIGIDPSEYCRKGVAIARAIVMSDDNGPRPYRLTYTDQLSIWLNGDRVFDGERRGWYDPGRSEADGWGRLMPDQFEVELPLQSGENEILVRLEVNEPLFGSGFWMRSL